MSDRDKARIVFWMRLCVSSGVLLGCYYGWLLKFDVTLPRRNALRISSFTLTLSTEFAYASTIPWLWARRLDIFANDSAWFISFSSCRARSLSISLRSRSSTFSRYHKLSLRSSSSVLYISPRSSLRLRRQRRAVLRFLINRY